MYNDSLLSKIQLKKLYIMPSGNVVRVIRLDKNQQKIIVHNYHSHSNEVIDFKVTPILLKRLYKIGEVAKIFGKKPSTIRKYERLGLIPVAKKISFDRDAKLQSRVYSDEQLEEIELFFRRRRAAGRKAGYRKVSTSPNQKD